MPTGSMPRAAKPTIAGRWRLPSRAECAPSSPTAISASARRNDKREQTQVLHLGTASTMCHGMDTRFWLDKADAEISGV